MVTLFSYQEQKVDALVEKVQTRLAKEFQDETPPAMPYPILLKAPTGSGKTVMLSDMMQRVVAEKFVNLRSGPMPYGEVVFVLLSPNSLHRQHLSALKRYGAIEANGLQLLTLDDLTMAKPLSGGDVLVCNWSSVNSEDNRARLGGERGNSLEEIIDLTVDAGHQIVVILDEAHHTAGSIKSQQVLRLLQPTVVVSATATPTTQVLGLENMVEVRHDEVVEAGVIVKRTIIEDDDIAEYHHDLAKLVDQGKVTKGDQFFNMGHVYAAVRKAIKLDDLYANEDSDVRTVVGIQLPVANNKSDDILVRDLEKDHLAETSARDATLIFLKQAFDMSIENEQVAVWLSGDRRGFEGKEESIRDFNSPIKVLIFKYALAVGYDLPRMKTGALLHDTKTQSFAVQTLGRFLRQPERHHYADEQLNQAYVYTEAKLMKEIIDDAADTVKLPDKIFPMRKDIAGQVLQQVRQFNLPNWFYQPYQKQSIPLENLLRAVYDVWQVDPSKTATRFNPKSFFETHNFEWKPLTNREVEKRSVSNLDAVENITNLGTVLLDVDMSRVNYLVAEINHELFQGYSARASITNFERALENFFKNSLRGDMTLALFKRLIMSDNMTNAGKYRLFVEQVLNRIAEDGISPARQVPKRVNKPWRIPEFSHIPVNSDSQIMAAVDPSYLYEGGRPTNFDSKAEKDFAEKIIPQIRKLLLSHGNTWVGYFKAKAKTSTWLGIPYPYVSVVDAADPDTRLFYSDWFIFYINATGKLQLLILETKKQRGEQFDSKANDKAIALQNWLKDQENVIGSVINLINWDEDDQPDNIRLIGDDGYLYSWLAQNL